MQGLIAAARRAGVDYAVDVYPHYGSDVEETLSAGADIRHGLIGAGVYSLWKERALLSWADAPMFGVGLLFSFLSAWICVRWLLRYISSHSFVPFAWYRIAFGLIVLATWWTGVVVWQD